MEYRHQKVFFACYIYLTFCGKLTSQEIYDVQRLIDNENDITEPYIPRNFFANPSHTGFFMYCTNRNAACSGFFSCHQCKCKSGTTFYSINEGCLSRESIKYETKKKGSECTLYSPDIGSSYVPLFSEYRNFLNVEILLEKTVFFHFLGVNTNCTAGNIYEYDWHGHKRLYHNNRCPNILKMTSKNSLHYLNYVATDPAIWEHMKGGLYSVDIDCRYQDTTLSSCFLFQVAGKYIKGADVTPTSPLPEKCNSTENPSTTGITTTTITQAHSSLENIEKITTATTRTEATRTRITQGSSSVATSVEEEEEPKSAIISLIAGIGAGLLLIVLLVVLFVFILRRIRQKKTARNNDAPLLNSQRARGNKYDEVVYQVPGAQATSCNEQLDEKGCTKPSYSKSSGSEYQFIVDIPTNNFKGEHQYEYTDKICTNGSMLKSDDSCKSVDMSKRPRLDAPKEVSNPYYGLPNCDGNEYRSTNNELYAIYSTINDVK